MSRSPSKSFTTRVHTRRPGPLWLVSVNYQPYLAFWFHKWLNEMGLLFAAKWEGFILWQGLPLRDKINIFSSISPTQPHTHTHTPLESDPDVSIVPQKIWIFVKRSDFTVMSSFQIHCAEILIQQTIVSLWVQTTWGSRVATHRYKQRRSHK